MASSEPTDSDSSARTVVDRLLDRLETQVPPTALKTWQALRSRYGPVLAHFERRYMQSGLAQRLFKATGVEPAYWSLAGGLVATVVFWTAFKRAASLVVNLVGFAYPVYRSVKAIEEDNPDERRQWLSYWTLYALFNCAEHFADVLLHWLPFYYWAKMGVLVYSMHPATRGAEVLYAKTLAPMYQRYHNTIDRKLDEGRRRLTEAARAALDQGASS